MSDFLATIGQERLERVLRDAAAGPPFAALREEAEGRIGERRSFEAAVHRTEGAPLRVVAEVKEASPSAGTLRARYDPVALAEEYVTHGAAAISVLTEPSRFHGSIEHLAAVRGRVPVPVLLKDFVVHERQIFEAGARGADAVLLILALLERPRLRDYAVIVEALGMTALLEVHDEHEIDRALELPGVIGINNRDLRTLAVRPGLAERLLPRVPAERVRIAESGYRRRAEIEALERAGADGVLVGEALLRASTVAEGFAALFGTAEGGGAGEAGDRSAGGDAGKGNR
ncbi:MAG TPA: indole-3-glycerol phosphate synthase TrpC [Candidatus Eisenbacteria bacterium]